MNRKLPKKFRARRRYLTLTFIIIQSLLATVTFAATDENKTVAPRDTSTAYWTGSVDNVWSTKNAGVTNWSTNRNGVLDVATLPDALTTVNFNASVGGFPSSVLGTDFSIKGLYVSSVVTIAGTNTLTIGDGNITVEGPDSLNITTSGLVLSAPQPTITLNSTAKAVIGSGLDTKTAGLTKAGTGWLTLTGSNTYSGPTLVSGGTLLVNGSTAQASAVTVGTNTTLGGSGIVAGPVTVNGLVAPSSYPFPVGHVATLTTGPITFADNGGLLLVVGPGAGNNDALIVNGAAKLAGALALNTRNSDQPNYVLLSAASISGKFTESDISGYFVSYATLGKVILRRFPAILSLSASSLPLSAEPITFAPITFMSGVDPNLNNVVVSWNFGDGSPIVTGTVVQHVYTTAGQYNVSNTLTFEEGSTSRNLRIWVSNESVNIYQVSANLKLGNAGDSATLTAALRLNPGQMEIAKDVSISIGGFTRTFTLTNKGVGVSLDGHSRLRFATFLSKKVLYARVTLKASGQLKNDLFAGQPLDANGIPTNEDLRINIDGVGYGAHLPTQSKKAAKNEVISFGFKKSF